MARKSDQPLTTAQAKMRLREIAQRAPEPAPSRLVLAFATGWLVGRQGVDSLDDPLVRALACAALAGNSPDERREPMDRAEWPHRAEDS
jgi:hypothetical protein